MIIVYTLEHHCWGYQLTKKAQSREKGTQKRGDKTATS
jgi:hypothetical protein